MTALERALDALASGAAGDLRVDPDGPHLADLLDVAAAAEKRALAAAARGPDLARAEADEAHAAALLAVAAEALRRAAEARREAGRARNRRRGGDP